VPARKGYPSDFVGDCVIVTKHAHCVERCALGAFRGVM